MIIIILITILLLWIFKLFYSLARPLKKHLEWIWLFLNMIKFRTNQFMSFEQFISFDAELATGNVYVKPIQTNKRSLKQTKAATDKVLPGYILTIINY